MADQSIVVKAPAEALLSEANDHSSQSTTVRLVDLPRMLYDEVSATLGIGEQKRVYTRGHDWLVQALNPNHRKTGFLGAIGYRKIYEHHEFCFWPWVPRPDTDDFEDEYPFVSMNAGPQ